VGSLLPCEHPLIGRQKGLFYSGRCPTCQSESLIFSELFICYEVGRVIAQVVSRRLSHRDCPVRSPVRSCGICGGQSGTGASFLRVLRFPLPILIPLTAPVSSSIIWSWYNRPVSGRRTKWTQSHPTPRN
jgi:hypothetical protein